MKLALCVATMRPVCPTPNDSPLWSLVSNLSGDGIKVHIRHNTDKNNLGVAGSYDKLYHESVADVLAFIHDDVRVYEKDWDLRVLEEFEDPTVGVVGFGGALAHGSPDLYKVPYRLNDLARFGYRSNVDDAEVHGERFTGACDVSVLDGFALCIRRSFLDRVGGFGYLMGNAEYFNYDYAVCAMARRLRYRVRLVGVKCHHYGGATSTRADAGITSQDAYDKAHRWFYDEFRDVMPARVNP